MIARALVALIAILALVACGGTTTPATPPSIRVKTAVGDVTFSEVLLVDSFPEGCVRSNPACTYPEDGYKLLMLWTKSDAVGDPADFYALAKDAYVTGAGGERGDLAQSGQVKDQGSYLVFTVPTGAKGFVLNWPDNEPLPLGK